jgi:hypothetical protein
MSDDREKKQTEKQASSSRDSAQAHPESLQEHLRGWTASIPAPIDASKVGALSRAEHIPAATRL